MYVDQTGTHFFYLKENVHLRHFRPFFHLSLGCASAGCAIKVETPPHPSFGAPCALARSLFRRRAWQYTAVKILRARPAGARNRIWRYVEFPAASMRNGLGGRARQRWLVDRHAEDTRSDGRKARHSRSLRRASPHSARRCRNEVAELCDRRPHRCISRSPDEPVAYRQRLTDRSPVMSIAVSALRGPLQRHNVSESV
jgi:hypothetical protein